jgi:hypothetical protein
MLLGQAPAPTPVTLAPKANAVVWVAWGDMPAGPQANARCIAPARETIAVPGWPQPIVTPQPLHTLACGRLAVGPVQRSGYSPRPG